MGVLETLILTTFIAGVVCTGLGGVMVAVVCFDLAVEAAETGVAIGTVIGSIAGILVGMLIIFG